MLRSLEEFHHLSFESACELVSRVKELSSDSILHVEPYVIAFELVRNGEQLPQEKCQEDRAKALEIYERASRELLAVKPEASDSSLRTFSQDEVIELELRLKELERLQKVYGSKYKIGDLKKEIRGAAARKLKSSEEQLALADAALHSATKRLNK